MAINSIDKAFVVDRGLSFDDELGIFYGSSDPIVTILGTINDIPKGSLYIRTNGQLFQKIGTGDLDWTLFESGTGGLTGDKVCTYVKFFETAGVVNNIPLSIQNRIPFFESSGTSNDVPLTPCLP